MEKMSCASIKTEYGVKEISVYCGDVTAFDEDIDILTTSAYAYSYAPTPRTVFNALYRQGISVENLAKEPFIDLRDTCRTWLSREIVEGYCSIRRIGCVELSTYLSPFMEDSAAEQGMINSIRAYFRMLDIAAIYGVKMDTVALPLLGSGAQGINPQLLIVPMINECIALLKRNTEVKRICFIEKAWEKADMIAQYLKKSYSLLKESGEIAPQQITERKCAFISYSSGDKNIADNLCAKLEQRGIKVWYAPRDVVGPYAAAIAEAIDRASYFVVILSRNSMRSQHVLNEIDLAFQNLPNKIKFKPLRIDETMFTPAFKYYLSRQHWMDAVNPPLEQRLGEFVESLLRDSE